MGQRVRGRREFLVAAGVTALAACTSDPQSGAIDPTTSTSPPTTLASVTTATSDSSTTGATPASTVARPAQLTATDFEALGACDLLPDSAAGPFGLDEQFIRSDITEGYPGHPLRVGLRVVDQDCNPINNAQVEIWHADASGDYSAYADDGIGKDEGEGSSFCRGTQPVDVNGICDFQALYPGWYGGRTPHIHVRVRQNDQAIFTSQLYFDDDYSAQIYQTGAYAEFGPADVTNATDRLPGAILDLSEAETPNGPGTLALLNLAIRT